MGKTSAEIYGLTQYSSEFFQRSLFLLFDRLSDLVAGWLHT